MNRREMFRAVAACAVAPAVPMPDAVIPPAVVSELSELWRRPYETPLEALQALSEDVHRGAYRRFISAGYRVAVTVDPHDPTLVHMQVGPACQADRLFVEPAK